MFQLDSSEEQVSVSVPTIARNPERELDYTQEELNKLVMQLNGN